MVKFYDFLLRKSLLILFRFFVDYGNDVVGL